MLDIILSILVFIIVSLTSFVTIKNLNHFIPNEDKKKIIPFFKICFILLLLLNLLTIFNAFLKYY